MRMNGKNLEMAKVIAEYNFNNDISDTKVGFNFNGQFIINPWKDESGRIDYTTEEAVNHYGENNISKFIKLAKR